MYFTYLWAGSPTRRQTLQTGWLILSVHCCISSTQKAPATGNCSVSVSRMHELWGLQETEIISKRLLISCKFFLQLYFQGQMVSQALPLRRHMPFDCCSVLSAPHTPETTGGSPPAELIVQMLQHGLHPESGETPASESLEGSCTSPAVLLHWTPPSLLPSHGCGLKPHPQKPIFQFSPGCELQADGPKHRHPGLLTSTAAHWSPPVPWLQRLIQKCQPLSRALGRWFREGNGTPLQYSCLENPMDRGAW